MLGPKNVPSSSVNLFHGDFEHSVKGKQEVTTRCSWAIGQWTARDVVHEHFQLLFVAKQKAAVKH